MDNGTRMLHSFGTLRDQEHNIVQGLNNYQDSLEHQNVINETGRLKSFGRGYYEVSASQEVYLSC